MASFAQDTGAEGDGSKPPISTHSAFPPIVALWFAALLGLGSLVVPVALVEQLVVSTGISSVLPFTAPPLGMKARSLIALAFALSGALAGLLIARQVAKAHGAGLDLDTAEITYTGKNRSPISAHDELGNDGLDGPAQRGRRGRRSLAIEHDESPSEYLDTAPLPGSQQDVLSVADELEEVRAEEYPQADEPVEYEAAELAEIEVQAEEEVPAEDEAQAETEELPEIAPAPQLAEYTAPGFTTLAQDAGEAVLNESHDFQPPQEVEQETGAQALLAEDDPAEPHEVIDTAWTETELVAQEPAEAGALEFSPPSLAREETVLPQVEEAGMAEISAAPAQTAHDVTDFTQQETQQEMVANFPALDANKLTPPAATQINWQEVPIDEMGLVQLAERLGSSIQKRRAMRNASAQLAATTALAATPPAAALANGLDAAEADEAAQAMAQYFSKDADQPSEADHAAAQEAAPQDTAPAEAEIAEPASEEPVQAEDNRPLFHAAADEQDNDAAPMSLSQFAHLGLDVEEEDEEGDTLTDFSMSLTLPLNRSQNAAVADETVLEASDAEEADDEEFGSLLSLQNPYQQQKTRQQFVRIEDEPVAKDGMTQPAVVFHPEAKAKPSAPKTHEEPADDHASDAMRPFDPPANSPEAENAGRKPKVDAEENERALREALLNLQRMSGAA